MSVFRIYVEKKPEYAVEAKSVLNDIQTALRLNISGVRILNRYDADKLSREDFEMSVNTVFSEPAVDVTYSELPVLINNERIFAVEFLTGQFDNVQTAVSSAYRYLHKKTAAVSKTQKYILLKAVLQTMNSPDLNPILSTQLKAVKLLWIL